MFFSHTTPHISQSITLANAQPLKVTMGEDTQTLDEVVVTALGIKREQKALSYNVQQVKGDELTNIKDANFINALSGKVAGVTINASSAGAGAAAHAGGRLLCKLRKNVRGADSGRAASHGSFGPSAGAGGALLEKRPARRPWREPYL